MFNNKDYILKKIAQTPKGDKRAVLLKNETIRNAVLSSGANVTIYEGNIKDKSSPKDILSDIYVGLIQRKNKHGKFDGLGALGGLAERTSIEEFNNATLLERLSLIDKKDDVILVDNAPYLTFDIDIIRKNNVLREMSEELFDLGIRDITINPDKMELIPMPNVKDDNYMINIWDGKGECFAITPYCHIYKDEEGLIDTIIKTAKEQENGEVAEYRKVPLMDALKAYGNIGTSCLLEDGRDAKKDYRYPHEYLCAWALASKLLNHDENKIFELAIEIQKSSNHLISFETLAKNTKQNMEDISCILGISNETLEKIEKHCKNIHSNKLNISNIKKNTFSK